MLHTAAEQTPAHFSKLLSMSLKHIAHKTPVSAKHLASMDMFARRQHSCWPPLKTSLHMPRPSCNINTHV